MLSSRKGAAFNSVPLLDVKYTLKSSEFHLYSFWNVKHIAAHTLCMQQWEIYVCWPPGQHPIIQKGFASDQINAEQSQISQPWQQLGLLEGIKVRDQTRFLEGRGGRGSGGVYSQQQSNGHPLYDSYHRYSKVKRIYPRLKYQELVLNKYLAVRYSWSWTTERWPPTLLSLDWTLDVIYPTKRSNIIWFPLFSARRICCFSVLYIIIRN